MKAIIEAEQAESNKVEGNFRTTVLQYDGCTELWVKDLDTWHKYTSTERFKKICNRMLPASCFLCALGFLTIVLFSQFSLGLPVRLLYADAR